MIGNKLLELRKKKGLSQEEVAEKLNVTRQTISKWETEQSAPDFDKIIPLCELYQISADELLRGIKVNKSEISKEDGKRKKALGIATGILLYFLAVVWICVSIPAFKFDPILSTALFLLICGVATFLIVFVCYFYNDKKEAKKECNPLVKQINEVIACIVLIIYLVLSFITMAWHITWILWVIYELIQEVIKLIFMLRGDNYEK